MALFKNDVSEYVTPGRLDPARLVVTIRPDERDPDRHDVTARVDDDSVVATGSFVVSPEWRLQGTRPTTSKFYPAEPNRAKIGAQLFSALFSGALSRCWAQAVERGRERGGLHIVIRSTSYAVHALPWELLTDPTLTSSSQSVVMSEGWSVIRDRTDPETDAPAPTIPPGPLAPADVRILALTSPINGINQDNDPAIISSAFPHSTLSTTGDVRPGQLTTALEKDDAHLVHVLGTGHRARQGWQDLLVGSMERPEVMSGKSLSTTLRASSRLRILVLAACDSDQLAAQLATTVPAVVGIRGAISDASCLAFLGGFYAALGSGSTVAHAVASGRAQQITFASSLGDEWAQPVLFQSHDRALVLATSAGDEPGVPTTADTTGTRTPEERIELLERTIREANLRALREQWDPVERIDTPAFVQRQIDDLTAAVYPPERGDPVKRANDTAAQQPMPGGAGAPEPRSARRARHTPASPAAAPLSVARLAEATRQLNECRAIVEELRTLTDAMARTRLTSVVGEQELIVSLLALIGRADDQIARMATGPAAPRRACMAALEGLLGEPDWHVARATQRELRSRKAALDAWVATVSEEYRSLQLNFERLHHVVERAEELRFDDAESEAELALDVVGKFRTSDVDFRSGRYDTPAVAVQHAKARLAEHGLTLAASHTDRAADDGAVDAAKFETYTEELERKVRDAELRDTKLARRAELFLISGATVDLSVPYKVLLRRPNFGTIQESNLYDDVEVLLTDQDLFRDTIDTIAESSIQGIRSAAGQQPTRAQRAAPQEQVPQPAPAEGASPAGSAPTVRRAAPVRAVATDHLDQLDSAGRLERIGRRMYSLLIPDAMQRLIDETDEFPLTITSNNPELPWELLHDGTEFLCLKRTFARMPAQQTFPRRTRDFAAPGVRRKTTVLLIHSVHGEPLQQAEREVSAIEAGLATMSPAPVVTRLSGSDVTASRLTDELSLGDYDLIHYAGHAGFDAERPERSYLLLSTGEHFRAERVQRLLEGHPVVFLNACESSKSAPQAQGRSTGGTVAQAQGLASAFVYGGAQACVGSLWPVFDDTAAELAVEFYRQLIEKRQRVGEALRRARVHSHGQQQDRTTWAAYALYGDPSSLLAASGGIT